MKTLLMNVIELDGIREARWRAGGGGAARRVAAEDEDE